MTTQPDFGVERPLTANELHIRGQERRRIIGIVLREYALAKQAGAMEIADALDRLATQIEHSEPV